MAYVVTQACIACRYGDCTRVCPQSAFREGPNFVVIDPQACANCGLCEIVCPVQAIRADWALGVGERVYLELNARLAAMWPARRDTSPLPDADANAFVQNKREQLVTTWPTP